MKSLLAPVLVLVAPLVGCSTVPELAVPDPRADRLDRLERRVDALYDHELQGREGCHGAEPDHRTAHEHREHHERRTRRHRRRITVDSLPLDQLPSDELTRMGRALQHVGADGQTDGYRLSRIRDGSLPYRLGLRNGDIVHAINGHPLTNLASALHAWEAEGGAHVFEVELTRGGDPLLLEVELRAG